MTFCHSGKLGDLIYSLPVVKHLGGGSIFLRLHGMGQLSEDIANQALPLLLAQPYVESAWIWHGEHIDVDLDRFRNVPDVRTTNLVEAHFVGQGEVVPLHNAPWLTIDAKPHGRPVFARSGDHHGWDGMWKPCLRMLDAPLFVGSVEEHARFQELFGPLEWFATPDLAELARTIAGGSVFVGNQSCPYAIAEGLQVKAILEADLRAPNCTFHRPDVLQVWGHDDLNSLFQFALG